MTEAFIVFATAISGLLLTDPFYGGALSKSGFAKAVMLSLCVGSMVFHIVGRQIIAPERSRKALGDTAKAWWPMTALAIFILAGSGYARFVENIRESFLGMGLGMLFLPLVALTLSASRDPVWFMKKLVVVYALIVASMLSVLWMNKHVFHEEIFVALPLGAYFLIDRPLRPWKAFLGLALIGLCLHSYKNTTFLLVLTTLAGCLLVWLLRLRIRTKGLVRFTGTYIAVMLGLATVIGLVLAWLQLRSALPSGSVEYRTEMYGIAWRRFLDSPVWGTGFTEPSVTYFQLYKVAVGTNYLPTHSDILDILAHGGLIGFALWAATIIALGRIGYNALQRVVRAAKDDHWNQWRCLYVLSLVQLEAVITYAVNPPLIDPVHGFWIWAPAGVMWALHRELIGNTGSAREALARSGRAWRVQGSIRPLPR